MKNWSTDARYAARRLMSRKSYTLIAVITLALGVGGTAAVFGIARPLILDPLPYPNADRVAAFWRPGWWNEEEFTYLRDSPATLSTVVGDGRLEVAKLPKASFDMLVLDAFRSDAIPVHLLTAEAMRMYADRLRPGGVLGVMTLLLQAETDLARWAYARDPTHVAFYRPRTLRWIAGRHGWRLTTDARRIALFESPVG